MLTSQVNNTTNVLSLRSGAIYDVEQKIASVEAVMEPLRSKTQKKLSKIENEIANCNFLIESGIGSKKDQVGLRKQKRNLRQQRIKLWEQPQGPSRFGSRTPRASS